MPISSRTKRVDFLLYSNTGSDGIPGTTYTRTPSTASDGRYWAAKEAVNARESNVAMQSGSEVSWEFEVSREDGALLNVRSAIRESGTIYKITGLKPVEQMGERFVVASALEAEREIYDSVVE
jgi:hypothetical protein